MVCPACIISFIGSQAPAVAASVGTGIAALLAAPRVPLNNSSPRVTATTTKLKSGGRADVSNSKSTSKACCKPPKAHSLEARKPRVE